eukprot:s15_g39.t1
MICFASFVASQCSLATHCTPRSLASQSQTQAIDRCSAQTLTFGGQECGKEVSQISNSLRCNSAQLHCCRSWQPLVENLQHTVHSGPASLAGVLEG